MTTTTTSSMVAGGLDVGAGRRQRRLRSLDAGLSDGDLGLRDRQGPLGALQLGGAVELLRMKLPGSLGGLGLQGHIGLRPQELGLRRRHRRPGLVLARPKRRGIDLGQELPGLHDVVEVHQDAAQLPRHSGAQLHLRGGLQRARRFDLDLKTPALHGLCSVPGGAIGAAAAASATAASAATDDGDGGDGRHEETRESTIHTHGTPGVPERKAYPVHFLSLFLGERRAANPSLEILLKLSNALDVSVSERVDVKSVE